MIDIPVSSRLSFLWAEYGTLEVDGHAVVLRSGDDLLHLPVGSTAALLLQPGTSVTHAAVKACAESGCLLLWVGEQGVRCYASGDPGRDSGSLLRQAGIALDPRRRLRAARAIFRHMFDEDPPEGRSVEQMRGMEGARVRDLYRRIAHDVGVEWAGRDAKDARDPINRAISIANAALYGLVEAVVLALGYAPSIGVVHTGDPRSFVYDIADCVKFHVVTPVAMRIAKESPDDIESRVRRACRDLFSQERLAERIVSVIDAVLADG